MRQIIPYDLVKDAMTDVQHQVQGDITYQYDIATYNEIDHWASVYGEGVGDCDDYAITKLRALYRQFPDYPRAFRLAICAEDFRDNQFIGCHMVLLILTDRGTYCLDNHFPDVIAFDQIPNRVWCYLEPSEARKPWTHFDKNQDYPNIRVLTPDYKVI